MFGARCTLNTRHSLALSRGGTAYMGKFSSPLSHLAICNNTVHVAHLTTGPCGVDLYAFTVNLCSGLMQSDGGLSPDRASELRPHQTPGTVHVSYLTLPADSDHRPRSRCCL